MLELNNISLCIVDCSNYKKSIEAINLSTKDISFKEIVIITDEPKEFYSISNAKIYKTDKINSKEQYSHFIIYNLNNYINTDFVLIIQWDGYVKNVNAWTNDFLNYDYIGAPWWYQNPEFNVGNGGFSIRSKKLLNLLQTDLNIKQYYPEDHAICRTYGQYLKNKGITFAPEELAHKFSIEGLKNSKYGENYEGQFGFHSFRFTKFPNEVKQKIWMTKEEVDTVVEYLKPNDIMLEWGSGGSTLHFSKYVSKYISIEHDKEWYIKIRDLLKQNSNVNLYLIEANEERSIPTEKKQFKNYIEFVNKLNIKFDKVFIDGRGRQWCGIEVLPYLNKDALVFIHDWCRERYHSLLEYYDIVSEIKSTQEDSNGLVILRKKI